MNAIAARLIGTQTTKYVVAGPSVQSALLGRIPKGRIGRPADVAALAVFLASDEADDCTGATFYVDGGWLAG